MYGSNELFRKDTQENKQWIIWSLKPFPVRSTVTPTIQDSNPTPLCCKMKLFEHQRTLQMKKNYTSFFILFLLFAGCDSDTQSPKSADVIMPLAVGNEWYWDVEYFAPDGTKIGNTSDGSLVITSKRTVGGTERYVLDTDVDIFYQGNALVSYMFGSSTYIWVKY